MKLFDHPLFYALIVGLIAVILYVVLPTPSKSIRHDDPIENIVVPVGKYIKHLIEEIAQDEEKS